MDTKELWQAVLGELEVSLSRANFNTWFQNTALVEDGDGVFVVLAPNSFSKEWLSSKYAEPIKQALNHLAPGAKEVRYVVKSAVIDEKKPLSILPPESAEKLKPGTLNIKYIFENFLVTNNNKLAYAAAQAVAKDPGEAYNPLFIYGRAGLGKTHLLQAIGNAAAQNNAGLKVIYAPCEKFINELIDSIRTKKTDTFKSRYRKADILLIDDVQFLTGKVGSQEEFFHTFNELYEAGRQIVLSSDRPPKAIPTLEDRLRSRFEMGMIADIQPPDLETRMAILKFKCEQKGYNIGDGVLDYIAVNIKENIRELEGALIRIVAYCELNNIAPTEEDAKGILGPLLGSPKKRALSTDDVVKAAAGFYNISPQEIFSTSRRKEIVHPRQVSMYLLRIEAGHSYPKIAASFGGKDHTTVMHACSKIEQNMEKNEVLRQEIELIKEKLYN